MRILLLGGVVAPLLFALVVVGAAALRPDYSHVHQFISELGATGSANAALMNYLGFVPAGLLLVGFGVALTRALPREPLVLVSATLVVLFGTGVATSGIVSCDVGCPQNAGSVENGVHNLVAPVAFLCLIGAAALSAARFRTLDGWRGLAPYSAASAVAGAALLAALASTLETRRATGLWQRLLLLVLFGWCATIGARAFALTGRRGGASGAG